ncbi:MAG: DUF4268 domain-containing protein [Bacteroidetes bacterium]|nr:DUF4268 domain-containing protein [Patescibacteria group bacterium]MBU2416323.1 DUF4268 domain-containing protein [Patescibacteria group bacterium]MBU2586193.1 DUF4268 domain-containing protein [Bacteroidota bacterium]
MIGKLKRVPLREIWRNEAKDFTTWLAENIDTLSEEIGIPLSIMSREKAVGDFSLDLIAEDSDGQITIIENQLEKTNHDHLGKVLTYLSNLDAKTAIWISSDPRDEHVKAINWLNEYTPDDISFYLIKIEAVRIGESEPAPMFSIIAEPTEIAKSVGQEKKEYAERHHLRKEFWTQLIEKLKGRTKLHANLSPVIYHWIGTGAGRSGVGYNYVVTNDYVSSEVYLDRGKDYPTLNKERFDALYKNKEVIEKNFGGQLSWERLDKKRASRIVIRFKDFGLKNKETWNEAQEKMIDSMIRIEKAFKPYIEKLK